MTLPFLIQRLEEAVEGSGKLDEAIAKAVGADPHPMCRHCDEYSVGVRFTSSIDAALTLGRNDVEQRQILDTILANWNTLYDLKRCILFGCVQALKSRLP